MDSENKRLHMTQALNIRGIYATALTSFFLGKGIAIASPSEETYQRFMRIENARFNEASDGEIRDIEGGQGVLIRGDPVACGRALDLIKEHFLDVVFRERMDVLPLAGEVEFARRAKSALDEERNKIVPTLHHHHRLKIVASGVVDWTEKKELTDHPEDRKALSEHLEKRLIWDGYAPGKEMAIEHVKLDGRVLHLSQGELIEADFRERKLTLKRMKFKGRTRYDGLNIDKKEGDYAITEAREGDWFYLHTYFRGDGQLIGRYYNVNTPVEFYPDKIRYVDLDVDVIEWPNGKVDVIDDLLLEKQVGAGFLSGRLHEKAIHVAYELREELSTKGGRFLDEVT